MFARSSPRIIVLREGELWRRIRIGRYRALPNFCLLGGGDVQPEFIYSALPRRGVHRDQAEVVGRRFDVRFDALEEAFYLDRMVSRLQSLLN